MNTVIKPVSLGGPFPVVSDMRDCEQFDIVD